MVNTWIVSFFANISNDGIYLLPKFDDSGTLVSPSDKSVKCSLDMVEQEIVSEGMWPKSTRQSCLEVRMERGESFGPSYVDGLSLQMLYE